MRSQSLYVLARAILLLSQLRFLSAFQILYLQEPIQEYVINTNQNALLSEYSSLWTTTNLFAISSWVKIENYTAGQSFMLFRLTNNDTDTANDGRVILSASSPSSTSLFAIGGLNGTYWSPFFDNTIQNKLPPGAWFFVCVAVDEVNGLQIGYTYRADNLETVYVTSAPTGTIYSITPLTTVYWGGGDYEFPQCMCFMQYFRIYIDYIPSALDQLKNIAIMDLTSTLFIFHFSSNPQTAMNQTFPSDKYRLDQSPQPIKTQALGEAISNTGATPNFSPYNLLNCRSSALVSFPLKASNSDGLVVAFDFKPYSGNSSVQPVFTIRSTTVNQSMVMVDYIKSNSSIVIWYFDNSSNADAFILATAANQSVLLGVWNRIIIELVPRQPVALGLGQFWGNIWVNGIAGAGTYFGNIYQGIVLFPEIESTIMDFCGRVSDSTISGYYDMLNFLWFVGTENLYSNNTLDPTCLVTGFLNLTQRSCLQCAPGYYFLEHTCVVSCPNGYFSHADTKSCQKCEYANQYYTTDGYCIDCKSNYQFPLGAACSNCDPTCLNCNGNLPTQCTACTNTTYLQNNHTCSGCNTNLGYFINNVSCSPCDPSCSTCFGSNAKSCLSCPIAHRLYLCNNSCVPDGFYLDASSLQTANSASTGGSWIKTIANIFILVLPLYSQTKGMLSAILMSLHGEIAIFKYINVLFPANYMVFSKNLQSYLMQNPFLDVNTTELSATSFCIGKFEEFQLSSIFLQNAGSIFTFILIIGFAVLAWKILSRFLHNRTTPSESLKQKITSTLSTMAISFLLANFKETFLYIILQLKYCDPIPGYIESSFGLCFGILILYAGLIALLLYMANVKKSDPKDSMIEPSRTFLIESSIDFHSISKFFGQENFFCRNFILVLLAQDLTTVLVIFLLQDYGVVQAGLYFSTTFCMMAIVGVLMPFTAGLETFALGLFQGTKLVLGCFALVLGANEQNGVLDDTGFVAMGMALIVLIIMIFFITLLVAAGFIVVDLFRRFGIGKRPNAILALRMNKQRARKFHRGESADSMLIEENDFSNSKLRDGYNDNRNNPSINLELNPEIAGNYRDFERPRFPALSADTIQSPQRDEEGKEPRFDHSQRVMLNNTQGSNIELPLKLKLSSSGEDKARIKKKKLRNKKLHKMASANKLRLSITEDEFKKARENLTRSLDEPPEQP